MDIEVFDTFAMYTTAQDELASSRKQGVMSHECNNGKLYNFIIIDL